MFGTSDSQNAFSLSTTNTQLDTSIQTLIAPINGLSDPLQAQLRPASANTPSVEHTSSGVFTVGATGKVNFDYLFDGGDYEGEVAIFDLNGMDRYFQAGTDFFAREAALRALTNTDLGHIVISDQTEGARFSSSLPYEGDFNSGTYTGAKTFSMRPGERFGIMLAPNGKVEDLLYNRTWEANQLPLFSVSLANPTQATQFVKLVDTHANALNLVDGNTFSFEDLRLDGHSDRDFNDMIFQVRGATSNATLIDKIIDPQYDWRNSNIGKAIIDYAKPYVSPNNPKLGEALSSDILNTLKQAQEGRVDLVIGNGNSASSYLDSHVSEWLKTANQSIDATNIQGENLLHTLLERNSSGANQSSDIVNRLREEIISDIQAANSLLETTLFLRLNPTADAVNNQLFDTKNYLTSSAEEINRLLTNFRDKYDQRLAQNSNVLQGFLGNLLGSGAQNSSALERYNNLQADAKDYFESTVRDYNQLVQNASQTFDDFRNTFNSIESNTVSTFDQVKNRYYALNNKVNQFLSSMSGESNAVERSWDDWVKDTEARLEVWQKILTNESSETATNLSNKSYTTALPLIGIIDTGFSANDPDIDYSRVVLGKDWVGKDANPLLKLGEGSTHGTQILDIIGASRGNGIGVDGINDRSPLWLGRAIGSNDWAQSLVEFVDEVKTAKYPNAVVNLSFDLTQTDVDGHVTTRAELTPLERAALTYAQQNHVLIVAAAGNGGKEISALGQASIEFDNIITVGAAGGWNRASYSNYGMGLDIVAEGDAGTAKGTSVAAAKVTGAASLIWAANPQLNYRQVIDTLKRTATDLDVPNWDYTTGVGLLNIPAAVNLAKATASEPYVSYGSALLQQLLDKLDVPEDQQPDIQELFYYFDLQSKLTATAWNNPNGAIATEQASDSDDVLLIGVGTGAAVGGVIGGPVGAAVGGVFGGAIGALGGLFSGSSDKEKREAEENLRRIEGEAQQDIANVEQLVSNKKIEGFQKIRDAQNQLNAAKKNGASPEVLKALQDDLNQVAQQAFVDVTKAEADLSKVQNAAKTAIADATAKLEVAKKAFEERQSVLNPFRRLVDKALAVFERGVDWIKELPDRVARLGETVFEGVASLNPFSGDFWKGVVHPWDTLKSFARWSLDVAIQAGEVAGVNEIAETVADFIKAGTRSLSDREKAVARSVFGDSINLNLVRIDEASLSVLVVKKLKGADVYRPFTTFHTINTWGSIDDATLVHELTHVWQYENDGAVYIPNALAGQGSDESYDYGRAAGLMNQINQYGDVGNAFKNFNPEQQAQIIEDYYRYRENNKSEDDGLIPDYVKFVSLVSDRGVSELNQIKQIPSTVLSVS